MNLIEKLDQQNMKAELPEMNVGDTVRVHVKIKEGSRERIQVFEGTIIAKKHGGVGADHYRSPSELWRWRVRRSSLFIPPTLSMLRLSAVVRFAERSCTTCVTVLVRLQRSRKRSDLRKTGKRRSLHGSFFYFPPVLSQNMRK